jgi:hypothetical protein
MNGIDPGGRIVGEGLMSEVDKPAVIAPPNQSTEIALSPILQSSPFSGITLDEPATHFATLWELATVSDFSTLVYSSGTDTQNLTQLDLATVNVILEKNTMYYVRVKHFATSGASSPWSDTVTFKTISVYSPAQTAFLVSSQNALGDYFGYQVAVSGDGSTIAVGAYGVDNTYSDSGAVFVFTKVNGQWVEQVKLSPSIEGTSSYYGYSLALSYNGNRLAVGAPLETDVDTQSGVVYLYKRTGITWNEEQRITASDASYLDRFGISVSLNRNGDMLVVGAYLETTGSDYYSGAVYTFTRTDTVWTEIHKHGSSSRNSQDYFGWRVLLSGDNSVLVVSAIQDETGGRVYVYEWDDVNEEWTESQVIDSVNGSPEDYFGFSMALSRDGSVLAISNRAGFDSGNVDSSVSVYRHSGGTFELEETLLSSSNRDRFGYALGLSEDGSVLLIGAPGWSDEKGKVSSYQWRSNQWIQLPDITGDRSQSGDRFGFSLGISNNKSVLAVGAPYDSDNGSGSGSTYVFE